MKFAPAGTEGVLFCVWETRVQDFEAFSKATGHDPKDMWSLGSDGGSARKMAGYWKQRGHTWKNPGFLQGPTYPVCGISWYDATTFCKWLTEKERKAGSLAKNKEYRLPTDAEWSRAVETGKYPWGNDWPPPQGAGNYAGKEAKDEDWPEVFPTIKDYNDGHARTAPAGSFRANKYGLFDMGGNVWEWCEDWYDRDQAFRVLRGGAWDGDDPATLLSSFRDYDPPGVRYDLIGFRCVLHDVGGGR